GSCNPNPCENNGVCEMKRGRYKCKCKEPFKGRYCQKVHNFCRGSRCRHGECVLTTTPPYHECKCKEPFKPPKCRTSSPCHPSPCKNGGVCHKGRNMSTFSCTCPKPFKGTFCEIGPDDCYEGRGESYRGFVSQSVEGSDCLYWNSYFVIEEGLNIFKEYGKKDGLGSHRYCRNPDHDIKPWCFVKRENTLKWRYCDVRKCHTAPTTERTTLEATSLPPNNTITVKPTKMFATCGKPEPTRFLGRIYGGRKSIPGAHPWQVSLQTNKHLGLRPASHLCGGVLLESCWVLTAGHCIIGPASLFKVVMGGLDIEKAEPYDQTFDIEQVIVHENYTETLNAVYNDIALLKLKPVNGTCAKETKHVKTVCMPDGPIEDGTECTISGWGATETDHGSNQLLDAKVLLISQQSCKDTNVYGDVLDDSMFCAGNLKGGPDSCQGDSGGPLTCEKNGTHVIYGVVSWGDQCGLKNKPGVYARVTKFADWIKSKIW
ncbi:HABP2 protein, partial [Amia calva]|nr:HABP2 protein [Amia calva]